VLKFSLFLNTFPKLTKPAVISYMQNCKSFLINYIIIIFTARRRLNTIMIKFIKRAEVFWNEENN